MDEMLTMYRVYVKTDERGVITEVNSSAFLENVEGWTPVDEGEGDRYHHAQGNYLPEPLKDGRGTSRYKLENGQIVRRSDAETEQDAGEESTTEAGPDRLKALEDRLDAYERAYREGVNEA